MRRRFIFAGPIRSGSTWLAEMFKKNITGNLVEFKHESFTHNYTKTLKRWQRGPDGIYGSVGHDHTFFPMLDAALQPKWIFMWRPPLKLIESIFRWVSRNRKRGPRTDEIYARTFAVYSGLEAALTEAERRGTSVEHWHFDRYTTPEGFKALAKHLSIPVRDNLILPDQKNASPKKWVKASAWAQEARGYISEFVKSLPHVNDALMKATLVGSSVNA